MSGFWHTVGQYTIEEFDVALEEFYKSGAPKMYVFFKAIDSNENVNSDIDRFHPQYLKEVKELFENTMILVTNRR